MRHIYCLLAAIVSLTPATSCGEKTFSEEESEILIELDTGQPAEVRSADPQEDLITDMNLFIFNDRGMPESRLYLTRAQMGNGPEGYSVRVNLLSGGTYSVYALANAGYPLYPDSEEDVINTRYYFTYPDEYRIGIPMSGKILGYTVRQGHPLKIRLERTMAKISISIDRSRLSKDVSFSVNSISIGGCPKSVSPFKESSVESGYDTFIKGFSKSDSEVSALNSDSGHGKSGETAVYMFENLHGDLLENAVTDSDKILQESDPEASLCSYIEIRADYQSDQFYTLPGDELVYRFYLGDNPRNFDVRRNTHYHITVTPENDGLGENSWRVDQSGLSSYYPYYMKISPGTFIRGRVGESFHVRCEYYPKSAAFDIGIEELEYDRERGIYDYRIDNDGNGVTIMLKQRGTGMLYMETGAPINQSEIINVIVE